MAFVLTDHRAPERILSALSRLTVAHEAALLQNTAPTRGGNEWKSRNWIINKQ